jgi:hypothetical protein
VEAGRLDEEVVMVLTVVVVVVVEDEDGDEENDRRPPEDGKDLILPLLLGTLLALLLELLLALAFIRGTPLRLRRLEEKERKEKLRGKDEKPKSNTRFEGE